MTHHEVVTRTRRPRGIQEQAAAAYQLAVGKIIFAREAGDLPLGAANVIVDLIAAGIATSKGGPWTRQAFQGLCNRIRRRCAADPAFALELRSEHISVSPAYRGPSQELVEARRRRLNGRHSIGIAEFVAGRASTDATQRPTQQAVDALIRARKEANRLLREARQSDIAAIEGDVPQPERP